MLKKSDFYIVSMEKWIRASHFNILNNFGTKFKKPNCFGICQHAAGNFNYLIILYIFNHLYTPFNTKFSIFLTGKRKKKTDPSQISKNLAV